MNNLTIRNAAKQARVKLWQIAGELNLTDSNFSRMLRYELTQRETEKIMAVIARLRDGD